jgi:hypothetical protein
LEAVAEEEEGGAGVTGVGAEEIVATAEIAGIAGNAANQALRV